MSARPRDIHVVGSVPLPSTENVFRAINAALDGRVNRLPDGETGNRCNWVQWQEHVVKDHPQLAVATDARIRFLSHAWSKGHT